MHFRGICCSPKFEGKSFKASPPGRSTVGSATAAHHSSAHRTWGQDGSQSLAAGRQEINLMVEALCDEVGMKGRVRLNCPLLRFGESIKSYSKGIVH